MRYRLPLTAPLFLPLLLAQPLSQSTPERPKAEIHSTTKNSEDKTDSRPRLAISPLPVRPENAANPSSNSKNNDAGKTVNGLDKFKSVSDMLLQWALFVVALWGVITARRSLKAIERQVTANQTSADAAKISADAAAASAELAERALLLTERADILIHAVQISTYPFFNADSVVSVVFKNYGRTRGNRVKIRSRLLLAGAESDRGECAPVLVSSVLGSGETLEPAFPPVRKWMTATTAAKVAAGESPWRFEAEVTYVDVFDKPHHTKCSGTFMPQYCFFRVDENQEAD